MSSRRDNVLDYRCIGKSSKCGAKIKIDEQLQFAVITGKHNHKLGIEPPKPERNDINATRVKTEIITEPKFSENTSELSRDVVGEEFIFSKDVTTEVELVTNNRNVTLMFLRGFKFSKYFENSAFMSYRCVLYPNQATYCLARIKHIKSSGKILMRSEHNHPIDPKAYENFLETAVRVRKFTKKVPRGTPMNTNTRT